MVSSTREARREALRKREVYRNNYRALFLMLFCNSITIKSKLQEVKELPKRYFFKVLFERGSIAYDKISKLFLRYNNMGLDVYGLPLSYHLYGYDGYNVDRKPEEVVILRANDLSYPLILYFDAQIEKLVDIDMAIEQNLDACKTMTIVEVNDDSVLNSVANEQNSRRYGASLVIKNKKMMEGTETKVSSTGATFLVDKLQEARKIVLNETLSTIGIAVANTDKKERVQGMEVLASEGYAKDCLNTMIDTLNYDAKYGELDMQFEANTSLAKDFIAQEIFKKEEKENKNKEEINE